MDKPVYVAHSLTVALMLSASVKYIIFSSAYRHPELQTRTAKTPAARLFQRVVHVLNLFRLFSLHAPIFLSVKVSRLSTLALFMYIPSTQSHPAPAQLRDHLNGYFFQKNATRHAHWDFARKIEQ